MKTKILLMTIVSALFTLTAFAESVSPLQQITVGGRQILATAAGLSVYTFDPDKANVSNCSGGCAKEWPPVSVSANTVLVAPMGKITRADGTLQLTYEQHPLYTYVDDSAEGDINGDGLGGVWHLVTE
jgi:predicted lipoprotein with Yx(FWY)xxD motif